MRKGLVLRTMNANVVDDELSVATYSVRRSPMRMCLLESFGL